jgi:hypothetical protein
VSSGNGNRCDSYSFERYRSNAPVRPQGESNSERLAVPAARRSKCLRYSRSSTRLPMVTPFTAPLFARFSLIPE